MIKTIKNSRIYELNLLKNVRKHKVFNIFLLKFVDFNAFIQEIFHYESQQEKKFEVKKILRQKNQKYFASKNA